MEYFSYNPIEVPMNQGGGNKEKQYLLPVRINGETVLGLIDTGSPINFISYSAARRLDLNPEESERDGIYNFVGGLPVPYARVECGIEILPLKDSSAEPVITLESQEFRVSKKSLGELSGKISMEDSDLDVDVQDSEGLIILGTNIMSEIRLEIGGDRPITVKKE